MDLNGDAYLFNLSLLSITFTAVSALVMLLRQTMGGRLSNFDVYLLTTYVSLGFVIALDAILPGLVVLFVPPTPLMWAIASGVSASLLALVMTNVVLARRRATNERLSRPLVLIFAVHWLDVGLLIVNAGALPLQGVGLFATAWTLSFAMLLLAFVRRIGSLLGEKPGEDWDPRRG